MIHARVHVRPATDEDLQAINDIYNHYVAESHVTFDVEPVSLDARREWFTHYSAAGRHRLFVASNGERVIGFASSSRFRPKPGYLTSIETSVYLAPDATGRGAGSRLYETLFKSLEAKTSTVPTRGSPFRTPGRSRSTRSSAWASPRPG